MPRRTLTLSRPPFVVDRRSLTNNTGRVIAWENVPDTYRPGSGIVKADGAAAAAATSMPVDALTMDLPIGTILTFGSGEFAKLTQPAYIGDTSLDVEALVNGIEDNDEAIVIGTGEKTIFPGTVMAEMADKRLVPRAARPNAETASCILETGAIENNPSSALTGFGCLVAGNLFENLLPDATGDPAELPSAYKTELAAAGCTFFFEQYEDSLAE